MIPFISHPDMKRKYPIEITDLGLQPDHTTPTKIQHFQEYSDHPENAKFYLIIIRRRKIELISDGYQLIEVRAIEVK